MSYPGDSGLQTSHPNDKVKIQTSMSVSALPGLAMVEKSR